jgi:hypothetical protein
MKNKLWGFTFMELLVAISMSALVVSGLGAIFAGTIKVWSKVQDATSAMKSGKVAVDWLTRDIREGLLVNVDVDEIKFDNGVRYYMDQGVLKRDSDIISSGVEKIKFLYFNKSGNLETDLDKISFVSISLTIKDKNHTLDLTSGSSVRNVHGPELSI